MMQKLNYVVDGRYKGRMVVFSKGNLWINTGFLSLLRLDSNTVIKAETEDNSKRVITITYKDGSVSEIMLDEQLYELTARSFMSFLDPGLAAGTLQKPELPSVSEEKNDRNEAVENSHMHGTPRLAAVLLAIGFVAALFFHLAGRFQP